MRTELAIFVTPYVVFTDEDAERLFDRELERLQNREEIEEALPQPLDGGAVPGGDGTAGNESAPESGSAE